MFKESAYIYNLEFICYIYKIQPEPLHIKREIFRVTARSADPDWRRIGVWWDGDIDINEARWDQRSRRK